MSIHAPPEVPNGIAILQQPVWGGPPSRARSAACGLRCAGVRAGRLLLHAHGLLAVVIPAVPPSPLAQVDVEPAASGFRICCCCCCWTRPPAPTRLLLTLRRLWALQSEPIGHRAWKQPGHTMDDPPRAPSKDQDVAALQQQRAHLDVIPPRQQPTTISSHQQRAAGDGWGGQNRYQAIHNHIFLAKRVRCSQNK